MLIFVKSIGTDRLCLEDYDEGVTLLTDLDAVNSRSLGARLDAVKCEIDVELAAA